MNKIRKLKNELLKKTKEELVLQTVKVGCCINTNMHTKEKIASELAAIPNDSNLSAVKTHKLIINDQLIITTNDIFGCCYELRQIYDLTSVKEFNMSATTVGLDLVGHIMTDTVVITNY